MKDKTFKGVSLTDKISVPTQRTLTDAGQMIVPCAFARTGTQTYLAKSLGIQDAEDGQTVEVMRLEDDVFDKASMESFRSAPVTIGHPTNDEGESIKVTADNAKDLQVGMLEGMPVRDEDLLTGTLVITRQDAIDTIEDGTVELSAGYTCDISFKDGTYYQKNIKANHIAIVDKGRAGSNCAIADSDDLGLAKKEDIPKNDGKELEDSKEVTTDMTEAEAAEAVAVHEEMETENYKLEAEWYKNYAVDAEAMAKAHEEVAKAARKIAKKKAKSMEDSAEDLKGGDHNLADDVTSILVALDVANETVVKLESKLKELEDSVEEQINTRCDVIIQAKDMTDIEDFSGKSIVDIKKEVISNLLKLDLADKSDAYIEARFDILCEDSDNLDTPMGKLLKEQVVADTKQVSYEDPVKKARATMIERNKNK